MKTDAKGHGDDARRLREFSAFDSFSDDELAASRPSSTSHLEVCAMAADS